MANYKYYKRYCSDIDNVENFEKALADNFVGWCCHHRLQTWTSDGERRAVDITAAELEALGMYYGRPASELIFMKLVEHRQLHQKGKHHSDETRKNISEGNKGKQLTEETKKKISEATIGRQSPNKGKHPSEETRRKLSEAHKGKQAGENNPMYGKRHSANSIQKMSDAKKGKQLTEETKKKISEANKGQTAWNKGKKMSEEFCRKNSESHKGVHWYNDGKISIMSKECPEGFTPGRLR